MIVEEGSEDLINYSTESLHEAISSGNKWSFYFSPPLSNDISALSC